MTLSTRAKSKASAAKGAKKISKNNQTFVSVISLNKYVIVEINKVNKKKNMQREAKRQQQRQQQQQQQNNKCLSMQSGKVFGSQWSVVLSENDASPFSTKNSCEVTPDYVMQLMYLAKKCILPPLADKCSVYLQENLDASTVFHVLPAAQKCAEDDLLDHCWKVIEKKTDPAVKSDDFLTIENSVLEELVEKDSSTIKEVELIKAVDCWAEKECEKQGLVAEGSVKTKILGERIVKGIRFPGMEQKVVLDSDVLTKKGSYDLVKYFNSVLNTPVSFYGLKRKFKLCGF